MSRFILLVLSILTFSIPSSTWARDLHGRLGVGYNGQFANSSHPDISNRVPALSLKYGLTKGIAAAVVAGVSTSSPVNTVAAVKFFKNIFYETNLNFYALLAGGLVSGNSKTGAEFIGGLGAEFFIPGLESLGFSLELGASLSNITGDFALRTVGASILDAGVHFYF